MEAGQSPKKLGLVKAFGVGLEALTETGSIVGKL
jgi:hypothetical protein